MSNDGQYLLWPFTYISFLLHRQRGERCSPGHLPRPSDPNAYHFNCTVDVGRSSHCKCQFVSRITTGHAISSEGGRAPCSGGSMQLCWAPPSPNYGVLAAAASSMITNLHTNKQKNYKWATLHQSVSSHKNMHDRHPVESTGDSSVLVTNLSLSLD